MRYVNDMLNEKGQFMKGHQPSEETRRKMSESGKLKVFSDEHRKHLSESLIGRKGGTWSPESKKKQSEFRKGKPRPGLRRIRNWKGGITPENRLIRTSIAIRLWREAVFARDNFTCQGCGQRGGNLEAHHIKPFAIYSELRTSIENGITYCTKCHKENDKFRR